MAAVGRIQSYEVVVDVPSIAANITAEVAVAVPGVHVGDHYVGGEIASTLNAGLGLVGGYVSAANQVTLRIQNSTAGALDPASATMQLTISRGDDGSGDFGVGSGPAWSG